MTLRKSCLCIFICALVLMSNRVFAQAQSDGEIRFEEDIRPILTEHCASCHGGVKKQGGFSVLSRSLLLAETDSGQPAVVPADAESSELLRRVRSSDPGDQMPPQGHDRLSPQEIRDLEHWIQQGVTWPEHWAYQPLSKTTAQLTSDDGDASSIGQPLIDGINPVDWFVHKKLAQQKLQPSEQAGRRILLRRLSLDLTGLNPLPEELKSFEENELPDAFISQVDRLLASPHFGERWARHWLDEARYADSEGYEKDSVKNDAWRFRDWVIRAINDDMPFDEFTRRQIAGDLLPDATDDDRIATQFHLQAQFNLEGGVDAEEDRTKRVIDRVGTVSSVWLGSSLACCQCHDHPYDSFRQRDFYAMYAFFNNADFAADFLGDVPANADKLREERKAKWSKIADLLRRQVDDKNLSDDVQSQLSSLRSYDNSKGFTRYLTERKTDKRKTWVFTRGDFLQPDQAQGDVAPNVPSVLPGAFDDTVDRNRLDLAEWLVSTENPLTARVEVNKVWMHLFGQALTDQPQEFGSRGSAPSHPELLDFLASWFMHEGGWSRKKLIRLIVSSETWRQSSVVRPELIAHDPNNHFLARQNRFRVEAEIVRDLSLQVSGLLTDEIGGPSVFPPLPSIIAEQTYAGSFKFKASEGADRYRRGLYTFFRRTAIDPNLSTFDCPDSSLTSAQRDRSNNPLQALAALHNEVFHEAAQAFSVRLLTEGESAPESSAIIDRALVLTTGRHAYEMEKEQLLELQQAARIHYMSHPKDAVALCGQYTTDRVSQPELAAWIATMRIVLNMDEFLTRS